MKTVSFFLTDRQIQYLNALATRWRVNRSYTLREVIQFFMDSDTSSSHTIPPSIITHRGSPHEEDD